MEYPLMNYVVVMLGALAVLLISCAVILVVEKKLMEKGWMIDDGDA